MAINRFPLLLCALMLASAGCTSRNEEITDAPAENFSIPAHYRPLFQGGVSEEEERALLNALPYRSISLSRTGCLGPCPVYTVTLRNDLTAMLVSEDNLEPHGTFVGEVDLFDYGRLCFLIDTIGFASFKPDYSANWTDSSSVIVTLTLVSGKRITVSDYGDVGPIQLWGLTEVIDKIRNGIKWSPAGDEPPEPEKQ